MKPPFAYIVLNILRGRFFSEESGRIVFIKSFLNGGVPEGFKGEEREKGFCKELLFCWG
jgi:hypothetical protein